LFQYYLLIFSNEQRSNPQPIRAQISIVPSSLAAPWKWI
jgi:hypothetical protein